MRPIRTFLALALLCLLADVLLMGGCSEPRVSCAEQQIYYVATTGNDANCGTTAAPFLTIGRAASVVITGQTVIVEAGRYREAQPIRVIQSGTGNAPIVFKTIGSVQVIGDVAPAWKITGSYVTVEGFNVTLSARASLTGTGLIQVGEKAPTTALASGDQILNNTLHDLDNAPGASCIGGGAVDIFSDVDRVVVLANRISRIGPSIACTQMHGIYSGSTRAYIADNIISDIAGYGIQIWPQGDDTDVMNNDVVFARLGGLLVGADSGYTADHVYVANNIFRHITGALYCVSEVGLTGQDNIYSNNDVYQCPAGGRYYLNHGAPQNSLAVDPLFVTWRPDGSGDYHLQPTSQLIGKGSLILMPATDFYGTRRGVATIGAVT